MGYSIKCDDGTFPYYYREDPVRPWVLVPGVATEYATREAAESQALLLCAVDPDLLGTLAVIAYGDPRKPG